MVGKAISKLLLAMLIIQLATLFMSFEVPNVQAQSNWLQGWQYRKAINIVGRSNAGVDYQMQVFVRRSSGTDSGNIVYVGTKCKSDFSDIRFTDSNNNVLPYCLVSYTSDEANFWVKCSNVDLSQNATIYLYYGNVNANYVGSIDATFIFADPFSESTLNPRWTVEAGSVGTNIILDPSQRRIRLQTSSGVKTVRIRSTSTSLAFPSYYRVESFMANQYETNFANYGILFTYQLHASSTGGSTITGFCLHNSGWQSGDYGVAWEGAIAYYSSGSYIYQLAFGVGHNLDVYVSTTWSSSVRFCMVRHSNNTISLYHGSTSASQPTLAWNEYNVEVPNRFFVHYFSDQTANYGIYLSAFKIRKYVSPEPYIGSFGREETPPKPILTVNSYPSLAGSVSFSINGSIYTTPKSFEVDNGTSYTLAALTSTIYVNSSYRLVFSCWLKNGVFYSSAYTISTGTIINDTTFTILYVEAPPMVKITVNVYPSHVGSVSFKFNGITYTTPKTFEVDSGTSHSLQVLTTNVVKNSSYHLGFSCWLKNAAFFSSDLTISTGSISSDTTFTIVYDAIPFNITSSFSNVAVSVSGSTVYTPCTIYRGKGYTTFQILTLKSNYNSTHKWYYLATYVNGSLYSTSTSFSIHATSKTDVYIAYELVFELPESPPPIVPSEGTEATWYFRNDLHEVEGLTGYRLSETNSRETTNFTRGVGGNLPITVGFRCWVYTRWGRIELTPNAPVGLYTITSNGVFNVNATWSFAGFNHELVDVVEIRVYVRFGEGEWLQMFCGITDDGLNIRLPASTWMIHYSIRRFGDETHTTATFYWGSSTYPSRITLTVAKASPWDVAMVRLVSGDLVGWYLAPFTFHLGDLFYALVVFFMCITAYNDTGSLGYVLAILWLFGGVGSILSALLPSITLQIAYVLLAVATALTLVKLILA